MGWPFVVELVGFGGHRRNSGDDDDALLPWCLFAAAHPRWW